MKSLETVTAMIGVTGSASTDKSSKVTGHNNVFVSTAHPSGGFFAYSTGPHDADSAAYPLFPEFAVR